jgi:hypothetical protein
LSKFGFLILSALSLTSCADNRPPPVTVPPSAKTIAIVSSIPPAIRIATTGLTVFENALDVVDVPDWHLDDAAADAASAALVPRYEVVRARIDGWVVDTDTKLDKLVSQTSALTKQIRERAHTDAPVDLYLVISLSNTAQPYVDRPNVFIGVGARKMRHIFYTLSPVVHTFLQMSVLDGKTYDVIATTPLQIAPRNWGSLITVSASSPIGELKNFEWKDTWHEMSAAQHDLIHDQLVTLLSQSVTYTIREMQLAP